ncbi:hypothetical protein TNCV_3400811 [Trichonephila clavipes]|nr:hypothetical protein TNCV_3400811 [Trichonephila clavipes]
MTHTRLDRIDGVVSVDRYVSDILRSVFVPHLRDQPNALHFQDNARPYVVRHVLTFLDTQVSSIIFGGAESDYNTENNLWKYRGRHKNVARELLTSTEGAACNEVANRGRKEDIGTKLRATASASKLNASCIYEKNKRMPMRKIKDRNGCNVVAVIHPGSTRNVLS